MNRVYALLATLAVAGTALSGAYLKGRADGKAVEVAAQQEVTDELNQELRRAQKKLATLETQRLAEVEELSQEVDDLRRQADEDPNANHPAIGAGSVQRLNALR